MDPLDHATPEALFGDAIDDARRLKRAYAKLAKRFPPDKAPAAFQHLRALYEAARARLEAGPTPAPAPPPSDVPEDDTAWVAQRMAGVTVDTLDAAWADLRRRGVEQGSAAAGRAAFSLAEARVPGSGWTVLVDLVRHEHLTGPVIDAARFLLDDRPEDVDRPEVQRLLAVLTERAPLDAVQMRCSALLARDRGAEAWAVLNEAEGTLRAVSESDWLDSWVGVLDTAAWALPADELAQALDRLDDLSVDIPERSYWRLQTILAVATEAAAARTDPKVPPEVLTSARIAWTGDMPSTVAALLDLRDVPIDWEHLATHHPTVVHALDRLEQLGLHREILQATQWEEGSPTSGSVVIAALADALEPAAAEARAEATAARTGVGHWWMVAGAAFGLLGLLFRRPIAIGSGIGLLIYGWRLRRHTAEAPDTVRAIHRAIVDQLGPQVRRLAEGSGAYLAELGTAPTAVVGAAAGQLLDDQDATRRYVGDEHLRRAIHYVAARQAEAARERQGADDG